MKKKSRKASRTKARDAKKKKGHVRKRSKLSTKLKAPTVIATGNALTFDKVQALVKVNKKSPGFTDECVIAVCWKESSFDPSAQSGSSTAKGLMQMTNPAVDTVNKITPTGVHFEYADMLDASKAIQCGTYYLQWCLDQSAGDEAKGLDKYGGVSGYSTNVIAAENCLLTGVDPPMTCLGKIHSFQIDRQTLGLVDNESGDTRFIKKK
jgi:hypothetical protein